jgi:hypothetical protein
MCDKKHWCEKHDKQEFYVLNPFASEMNMTPLSYRDEEEDYEWLCEDCEGELANEI